MENLIRTILFMFFISPAYSQSYANNPVKAIIDNPESPELPSLILKASENQAKSTAKIDLNSIKVRNTFMVQFVEGQGLLVQMQPSTPNQLQQLFLLFLNNPNGSPAMSDSINASTPLTGEFFVSKGLALVQYSLEDVQAVVPTVRELAKALAKYRDRISLKSFKTTYALVPALGKSVIDQFLSSKLIFVPANGSISNSVPPSTEVPSVEGQQTASGQNKERDLPQKQESSSTANQGYPDFPNMDDLGQAAEKLKDVFLGGGQGSTLNKDEPNTSNKSGGSRVYTVDIVDHSPVLESCESANGTVESRMCFEKTIQKLAQHNFDQTVDLTGAKEGKIYLQFVVDAKGELVDREVLRGVNSDLDRLALRALVNIKLLAPAKIDDAAVKIRHVVTIEVSP